MADVLRRLLDSGELSDENCHSILRGLGKKVDGLDILKREETDDKKRREEADEYTSDEEEEVDEEYRRQVRESWGFDIDAHVRIPECGISPRVLGKFDPPSEIALYGRLGVHCFNFEKGRSLRFMKIPKYNTQLTITRSYYVTVEVKDPVDNSAHNLQTLVTRCFSMNGEHLRVFIEICRLKPETPGEGDAFARLDEGAIDENYKGLMPNFLSGGKAFDRLRFYEVQEQDICGNDWLRLYTEFALYCVWRYNEAGFASCLPAEIKKIVVETFETHREPSLKLKSPNAIFHINFRAKGRDYRSVVRRTTDGKTGHIILEINSWAD